MMKCVKGFAAAVVAVALGVVPLGAAQQAAANPASLEAARAHLLAGRLSEARALVNRLPQTAASVRLHADIDVAGGELASALAGYEQLAGRFATPASDLLRSIVISRAVTLRTVSDARVPVDACEMLIAVGAPSDCVNFLTLAVSDTTGDFGTRIAAARVLEQGDAPGSKALTDLVIQNAITSSPVAAAGALASMLPARSTEALKALAFSDNPDARYLATAALARRRGPDVIPTLRAVAADERRGSPRLIAHIGLAGTGEAESVRFVHDAFPLLDGRERLDAALALVLAKDPEGPALVAELTTGQNEMVRIDAAEVLYATRPAEAERAISAGLASTNPWVHARAMEAVARVRMKTTPAVRRAMLDSNASVAVAALRAVVSEAVQGKRP